MSELISPFVAKRANECPFCGGELAFINVEITATMIDGEGHVLRPVLIDDMTQVSMIRQQLICLKCHHIFEIITDKYNLTVKPAYGKGRVINESKQVSENPFLTKTKSLTVADKT